MKKLILLKLLLFFLLSSEVTSAATITAIKKGAWSDDKVWDLGRIPEVGDDVIIDGYDIDIDDSSGDITINSLILRNLSDINRSKLTINTDRPVIINGNLEVIMGPADHEVHLKIEQQAQVTVNGSMQFTRLSANDNNAKLKLEMKDNAQLNVSGSFTFDYGNANVNENGDEIHLKNNSVLTVTDSVQLIMRQGSDFKINMNDAAQFNCENTLAIEQYGGEHVYLDMDKTTSVNVTGDFHHTIKNGDSTHIEVRKESTLNITGDYYMTSDKADAIIKLVADGTSATVNIDGNIQMSANSGGDAMIDLRSTSTMNFGGNFSRPDNFGSLSMDEQSTIIFNGVDKQELPASELFNNGGDRFAITNIRFNNTSGEALELGGPMIITDEMTLSRGVIKCTDAAPLIIEDRAIISGGSDEAFIDGPIIKKGSTNGEDFVFPTGDSTIYAPITISPLSSSSDQYTAQYFACPPPVEGNLTVNAPLASVSSSEFWTLTRDAGTSDVDVSLAWTDASASDITDLDAVQVAYYDSATGWFSAGNGGTTGGLGNGVSGTVVSDAACPPPVEVDPRMLTFGFKPTGGVGVSGGTVNNVVLPVELVKFNAKKLNSTTVVLTWETSMEVDNSHFVLERSTDGVEFTPFAMVYGKGANYNSYKELDHSPFYGTNYYRLRQVDLDGSYELFNVVAVEMNQRTSVLVYPNPTTEYINIYDAARDDEPSVVYVYDEQGRQLHQCTIPEATRVYRLSISEMNTRVPGTYFLKVCNSYGTRARSFIVNELY
ncbi:MAG: T9SS type A sorting domain-containing protein [Bacteroidota bacterium]